MSSAILCVYVDSATDLPHIHPEDKPDPFVRLTVAKTELLTSVKKETDTPIWEQAFTFLVTNPENDTLKLEIIGQTSSKRHGDSLGQLIINISNLLAQNDLQNVLQAFQSGTTTKIKLSMALKILRRAATESLPQIRIAKTIEKQSSSESSSTSEVEISKEKIKLQHIRQMSADASMGIGSIKLSLHYSAKYHILKVTVHKIM